MKVRCLFNSHAEVPELIEKYGYFERTVLHITKGKEYTVYAIICNQMAPVFLPSIEYLIKDDTIDLIDGVSNYSVKLFDVIDSNLGGCDWHYSFEKNGMDFIIGYDEFVNNQDHYEGVLLGEANDLKKFMKWCEIVDATTNKKQ
jgi:hypothetical protein